MASLDRYMSGDKNHARGNPDSYSYKRNVRYHKDLLASPQRQAEVDRHYADFTYAAPDRSHTYSDNDGEDNSLSRASARPSTLPKRQVRPSTMKLGRPESGHSRRGSSGSSTAERTPPFSRVKVSSSHKNTAAGLDMESEVEVASDITDTEILAKRSSKNYKPVPRFQHPHVESFPVKEASQRALRVTIDMLLREVGDHKAAKSQLKTQLAHAHEELSQAQASVTQYKTMVRDIKADSDRRIKELEERCLILEQNQAKPEVEAPEDPPPEPSVRSNSRDGSRSPGQSDQLGNELQPAMNTTFSETEANTSEEELTLAAMKMVQVINERKSREKAREDAELAAQQRERQRIEMISSVLDDLKGGAGRTSKVETPKQMNTAEVKPLHCNNCYTMKPDIAAATPVDQLWAQLERVLAELKEHHGAIMKQLTGRDSTDTVPDDLVNRVATLRAIMQDVQSQMSQIQSEAAPAQETENETRVWQDWS